MVQSIHFTNLPQKVQLIMFAIKIKYMNKECTTGKLYLQFFLYKLLKTQEWNSKTVSLGFKNVC